MVSEQDFGVAKSVYENFTPELFVEDYIRTWTDIRKEQELIDLNQNALNDAKTRDRDPEDQKARQRLKNITNYLTPEIALNTSLRDDYLAAAAKNLTAVHAFLDGDRSDPYYEDAFAELDVYNSDHQVVEAPAVAHDGPQPLTLVNGNSRLEEGVFVQNPYAIPVPDRGVASAYFRQPGNDDPCRPLPPVA